MSRNEFLSRDEFLKHLRKLAIEFYDKHHSKKTLETLPESSTLTDSSVFFE